MKIKNYLILAICSSVYAYSAIAVGDDSFNNRKINFVKFAHPIGVAGGTNDTDAVNVRQLNTVAQTVEEINNQTKRELDNIEGFKKSSETAKTKTKIDRGLASSAALTGLFQPYGIAKVNVTAALGGYGSSQAIAVGTGYRINENAAVKAGLAYSGGNNVMYNASFNLEW